MDKPQLRAIIADLQQQLAAVTAERDTLRAALDPAAPKRIDDESSTDSTSQKTEEAPAAALPASVRW